MVHDNTVYVGGVFGSIGGQTRRYLAALDASAGLATSWDPSPNNQVFSLAVSGDSVYAAGAFYFIGEELRTGFAVFSAGSDHAD